jgi:hypothetical protein
MPEFEVLLFETFKDPETHQINKIIVYQSEESSLDCSSIGFVLGRVIKKHISAK